MDTRLHILHAEVVVGDREEYNPGIPHFNKECRPGGVYGVKEDGPTALPPNGGRREDRVTNTCPGSWAVEKNSRPQRQEDQRREERWYRSRVH